MHHKLLYLVYFIIGVILLGLVINFVVSGKHSNPPLTTTTTRVEYKNTDYGFVLSLPNSWKGYSIVTDKWEGEGQVVSETGPLISVRNPNWTSEIPRQDIPIMVFTIKQWSDLEADKFHIGAAPIGPGELGRNDKYVFAIPARYNFSFLTGFEEVDQIIKGNNFKTFAQ